MRLILSYTHRWLFPILLGCAAFLLLGANVQAETVVTNSVSVSADSDGESRAVVTTRIDGKVVKHWSATGTTTTHSHTVVVPNDADKTTNTSYTTAIDTATETKLKAIIMQLLALITYYELLLTP